MIALVNVILFSPGFINISLSKNTFQMALGITIIVISIIVFVIGNMNILLAKELVVNNKTKAILTSKDYMEVLNKNKNKQVFTKDIMTLLDQIQRLKKKKDTILTILQEKFNSSEMSYSRFLSVIDEIEKVFDINMKSIVNKINIFDVDDYENTKEEFEAPTISEDIIEEKMKIYNEYITFVKNSIEDNEQILLKLDKILLELSNFNSLEDGELENMEIMEEIDDLISKIKFYK